MDVQFKHVLSRHGIWGWEVQHNRSVEDGVDRGRNGRVVKGAKSSNSRVWERPFGAESVIDLPWKQDRLSKYNQVIDWDLSCNRPEHKLAQILEQSQWPLDLGLSTTHKWSTMAH